MLKLTFLGTSAGLPTKQRNVTGLAISLLDPHGQKKDNGWLLIDCGEATQHQILHTSLSLLQLHVICITHVHGDHCYGLAGILSSMAMFRRTTPLVLIAPSAIQQLLITLINTTELYLPFDIQFIAIEQQIQQENSQPITLTLTDKHHIMIEIFPLSHRTPSYAFKISQHLEYTKLNVEKLQQMNIPASDTWGKLKQGQNVTLNNGQLLKSTDFCEEKQEIVRIVVGGDNDNPQLLADAVRDVILLVHEATYTQDITDKILAKNEGFNPQHSSAKMIAEFANNQQLANLILTHFSARYQMFDNVEHTTLNMGHIRAEVEQYYQGNYFLAKDFTEYEVTENSVKVIKP